MRLSGFEKSHILFSTLVSFFIINCRGCMEFQSVNSRTFAISSSRRQCDASLGTAVLPELACALTCHRDRRCFAYRHSGFSQKCVLLEGPCSSASKEGNHRMMVKVPNSPFTWRFDGSFYFLSQEKGTYDEMGKVCARYGMYRWAPTSLAEVEFIERAVLPLLGHPYTYADPNSRTYYRFWIGITDRPNGNCTLTDLNIGCPVVRYPSSEPSHTDQECVCYRKVSSQFQWDDINCNGLNFAFCEGLQPWFLVIFVFQSGCVQAGMCANIFHNVEKAQSLVQTKVKSDVDSETWIKSE